MHPRHEDRLPVIATVTATVTVTTQTPPPPSAAADIEEGEISNSAADDDRVLEPAEEPDPDLILAERRRKRAQILAKYAASATQTPEPSSTPSTSASAVSASVPTQVDRAAKRLRITGTDSPTSSTAPATRSTSVDPTAAFSLEKDDAQAEAAAAAAVGGSDPSAQTKDASTAAATTTTAENPHKDEVSAADYDPQRERERGDDDRCNDTTQGQGRKRPREGQEGEEEEEEEEEVEVETDDDDDDDDDDDMFAIGGGGGGDEDEEKGRKKKKKKVVVVKRKKGAAAAAAVDLKTTTDGPAGLLLNTADNYDDSEGYYKVLLGEQLDHQQRYHVVAHLGKGMFATVVKAKDRLAGGADVAIKIVRSQESMYKAGLKEAQILRRLRDADPDDKRHVVRLDRTFEHRGHLCLVFESLSMNLREVVKRYGRDVGLNLRAVRAYASQMFLALTLLRKCEILHADLKPDNILVNESKSTLKVSDLGSASDASENEITPYLVSRFYRAPEIILGLPYDYSLDVWSIACTLYELYTGKILFPGRTNNHMLLLIMETKGKFNHKLIRKARFHDRHFDESMNFLYTEKNDSVTVRAIPAKPSADMRSRLMPSGVLRTLKDDEARLLTHFVDLLEKMLSLEPARRPTPKELLNHPFIRSV
ncbi:hypothetical protein JCM3774_005990 [Rhodotorula dairenensis]